MDNLKQLEKINNQKEQFYNEVHKIIVGQDDVIEHIFIALLCKGHILLEGVPGLGKTLIIRTISDVLDLKFNRIQFTPDLMPSDITGTQIVNQDNQGARDFKFIKGPVFSNIILADEINRTPPKTQSALLEAMQECSVTIAGKTYSLDQPFFVLATQNPIEQEGTYPLPEAQLDRFMFNILIDYPTFNEEKEVVVANTSMSNIKINNIMTKNDIISYHDLVKNVPVSDNVIDFAVKFTHKTRLGDKDAPKYTKQYIDWGAGPRASSNLILAAKAKAILNNRPSPEIDDVKSVIKPVLRHRIIPNFNAEAEGIKSDDILDELMK